MTEQINFSDAINNDNFKIAWKQLKGTFSKSLIKDIFENLDYEINLKDNIWNLVSKIKNDKYIPKRPITIEFAKSKGLYRPVSVLEIEDLIVFQSIMIKIAPVLDELLLPGVFAVRTTGNDKKPFKRWYTEWPKYQKKIKNLKNQGYNVLINTDISTYFDNIDHGKLKEIILQNKIDKKLVDLLFFMLETWTHRPNYSANLYRGIPQINNNESSFFLSNIFLIEHDRIINNISDSKYIRWIDDMNIAVKNEISGKIVLNRICSTLRDLYLYPNISKTEILVGDDIDKHFFFEENDLLDDFEEKIKISVQNGEDFNDIENSLIKNYEIFLENENGLWFKILKRYYTAFTRIRSHYLLRCFIDHLRNYPTLDEKICFYLLAIEYSNDILDDIIKYIKSPENLYESVEIHLLELLLNMRVPNDNKQKLLDFGKEIFIDKDRNWYLRSIAILIIAKYGENSDIRKLAQHYYTQYEEEAKLRKYLIAVSTILDTGDEHYVKVINKAREEYSQDIQSIVGLIDGIKTSSDNLPKIMMNKLTLNEIHLPNVKIKYMDMKTFILFNLLCLNSNYYPKLKSKTKNLIKYNSDPIMDEKLRYLSRKIS